MRRTLLHLFLSLAVCLFFFILTQRAIVRDFLSQDLPRPLIERDPDCFRGKTDKVDAPEEFERYERDIRTRDGDAGPAYPANYRILEVQKANDRKAVTLNKVAVLPWTEVGP